MEFWFDGSLGASQRFFHKEVADADLSGVWKQWVAEGETPEAGRPGGCRSIQVGDNRLAAGQGWGGGVSRRDVEEVDGRGLMSSGGREGGGSKVDLGLVAWVTG